MNPKEILNTKEAAAILGMKPATLDAWRHRGQGPSYMKMGKAVRYRVSDLHEFMDAQTRTSTSDPGGHEAAAR